MSWAEEYDRDVNDMFAIQSEVAQKVAEQLHTKISLAEKSAIERAPTANIGAFDLYTRARNIFLGATNSNSGKEDLLEAADLLNQALAQDSSYFEAYCQLGGIHDCFTSSDTSTALVVLVWLKLRWTQRFVFDPIRVRHT